MKSTTGYNTLFVTALVAATLTGFGLRTRILEAQPKPLIGGLPFTMESALHFDRIRALVDSGVLPRHDPSIFHPEGIDVYRTYSVGDEWLYAWGSRWFPDWWPLSERIRWMQVAGFSLGIAALGWWLFLLTGSRWAGAVGAAWYAVILPGILRSSGIEISRENLALPLFLFFLAFERLAACARRTSRQWAAVVMAAVCLTASMMFWDLTRYLFGLWLLARMVEGLWRGDTDSRVARSGRWLYAAGLLIMSVAHPYYRAHAAVGSPVMGLLYGWVLWSAVNGQSRRLHAGRGAVLLWGPAVLLLGISMFGADGAYGHFGELLAAKIRFLNMKPTDPSLLTYNARILWVPALHSADMDLVRHLFFITLPLTLAAVGVIVRAQFKTKVHNSCYFQLIVCFVATFLTFVFFVRFYVFVAIFMAALMGAVWACVPRRPVWTGLILAAVMIPAWMGEAARVVISPERWGRANVYYEEQEELIQWMREHIAPKAVCANFGVSGSIRAYAKCPIVLHPKFENSAIRERVRTYGEQLFTGTESAFRAFMTEMDTDCYVHSKGAFAAVRPEWQMRYFVDALDTSTNAPAWLFERRPGRLRYFNTVFDNRKFAVYRMVTVDAEQRATRLTKAAQEAFARGALDEAEQQAIEAARLDPKNAEAIEVIRLVDVLRRKGFSYEAD